VRALSVLLLVVVIACFCRRLYTPALLSADISNDGLSCVIDVNMLDADILVTAVTQAAERLDLSREGSHKPSCGRRKCRASRLACTATSCIRHALETPPR
jgi:hypothetical protein